LPGQSKVVDAASGGYILGKALWIHFIFLLSCVSLPALATEEKPCSDVLSSNISFNEKLQRIEQALTLSWSADTSASTQWTANNPSLGQCAVTALVVQDLLGGEIVWAEAQLPDGKAESHYKNLINGSEVDLTVQQFPNGSVIPLGVAKLKGFTKTRDYILSFESTRRRYLLLRERMLGLMQNLSFR